MGQCCGMETRVSMREISAQAKKQANAELETKKGSSAASGGASKTDNMNSKPKLNIKDVTGDTAEEDKSDVTGEGKSLRSSSSVPSALVEKDPPK